MTKFKQVPYITRHDDNDVELRPEAHYEVEMRWAVIGEVESEVDPNNGDVDWTLKDVPDKSAFNFDHRNTDWSKIKTIHFDKSCTVPRFKLGKFCINKNIRVIRDSDKADFIVYGKQYTDFIVDTASNHIMYKSEVISRIKKMSTKRNLISEILPVLEKSESEYILFDNDYEEFIKKAKMAVNYGEYLYIKDYNKYQIFMSSDCKYIHQNAILKNMGSDTIDEHTFKRLCDMFSTEDIGNHKVAMEIMTNSDYESSIVYLLELMRRYYHDNIYYRYERNNVSFKALREYLGYEPKYDQRSLDNIIENVTKKGLLTENNYNLILKLILEEEKIEMEDDENKWKITAIDLTSEYKAKIIWNKKEEIKTELNLAS